ncbi:putative bifunctional diguanylate cyclase/phosphodiesterase [Roseibium sp.]|uniref:putative bifunctional diguanylate cyclase/phosphodiesterase n=1 Tax=Roseibium sp. TaxID=1936156 RepID=UPI003A978FFD
MGVEEPSSNTNGNRSYGARFSARLDRILREWTAGGRQIARPLKAIFLLFLFLTVAALTTQNFVNEYHNLEAPLDQATDTAEKLLQHQKATGTSGLEQTLLGITTNSAMIEAMKSGSTDNIRAAATKLLAEMETFHDVSEFTIYDAGLTHEYQAFEPGLFEKADTTYLVRLAKTVDRVTRGFELDSTGQTAIAVVRPWKVDGKLIGFIKLTMNLRRPLILIGSSLNTEVLEVYSKDHLKNNPRLMLRSDGWDSSGDHAYLKATSGHLPENFDTLLEQALSSSSFLSRMFTDRGRLKVLSSVPLTMADGSNPSTLILLHDITDSFRSFARSTGVSLLIGIILAIFSWFIFKRLIFSLQNSIRETRQKLESEVAANTKELEHSRYRLIEAQKIAAVGSWERDLTTGMLHWTQEMFRIVGLPGDTDPIVARQYLYRIIPPPERPYVEACLDKAIKECADFDFEHQIVRRDGSIRYLRVRGYVIADENDVAARVIGTTHDITDWHAAQEQNQRLAGILEASLNEVYVFDANSFLFEHANKCARENLGYSMEELLILHAWNVNPDYSEEYYRNLIRPLLSGEKTLLNIDGNLKRKDGSEYPVEVRLQVHRERNKDLIVAIANDISERMARERETQAAREKAERMAYFDALTQLPNRAGCQREAERLFGPENPDRPAFIIHMDLDNFKRINDTLGHTAGDSCLEEVGERLKLCCVGLGTAYRWGGDEFVVIAEDPGSDSEELCERLNVVMRAPMEFEGNQIWPSVSMGVARCPEDGEDFGTLLVHADLALYRSKDNGKDRWSYFTSDMKIDSDEEARMDKELRQAIRRDEFFLVFQPQVNIRTQRVTGIEALVRWQHPTRGTLGPGAFLPVVEKSNLASTLGEIVINKALAAARSWQDLGVEFGRIAVNLSPSHLTSGTLLHDFDKAMERHGVGPEKITAEVLESVFLDNSRSDNVQVLDELHRIGVHIELDDFGTGYASLSHVADLPINGLKIDRSFTAQILDDNRKEIVVNQLIHLARALNIGLICEGVETEAQIDRLQMMGDFSVQGYYIARPMPYEDITGWLQDAPEELVSMI